MAEPWRAHPEALDLLDRGGPFAQPAYRTAWLEAHPGSRDASFGAAAADGTLAAVALVRGRRTAESVPLGYGGVVATRPLEPAERASLLAHARAAARVQRLVVRSVAFEGGLPGRAVGRTRVVFLDGPPAERFDKKVFPMLDRARGAGGEVRESSSPEAFLELYGEVEGRRTRYPAALLRSLGRAGALRCFDVVRGGEAVGSAVAVTGGGHWMYWLAAQSGEGRSMAASYLALAALLERAHAEGAAIVNLGASDSLEGVDFFKKRFGSVERSMVEERSGRLGADAEAAVVAAVRRVARPLVRGAR